MGWAAVRRSDMSRLIVDLGAGTSAFPHYWEMCVGSCHAALALRQDWREQLKRCHDELGFRYVRFHGLLNDDMSIYKVDRRSKSAYFSFFNVDSILDFLLDIGMKPFIELSFMPSDMASGATTVFHYKGNVTPPADYQQWGLLVGKLAEHLVTRYGKAEVRKWFFEVWNEPNLKAFWAGSKDDYFRLYETAARAIKAVDHELAIGGPSTARNEWVADLKQYCVAHNVPLDFLSTHHYPTDVALGHSDMEARMARSKRGIMREMAARAREEAGDLPLYYTEWSNSPSSRDRYHDQPYAASFALKTVVDNAGLVEGYSFWTFSDIFEEAGFSSTPFHGGFGLLNIHGIPKPTYWAFKFLHQLGTMRVPMVREGEFTTEAVATVDGRQLSVLLYNHNLPLAPIESEHIELFIKGASLPATVSRWRIDDESGNPRRYWVEMGQPEYPDQTQLTRLMGSSQVVKEELPVGADASGRIDFEMPPYGTALITVRID